MAALDPVLNFATVTVSTGYDASATSIALTAGHGSRLPQPSSDGAFNLVWYNATDYGNPADDPNVEIVRITGRSTDTLTVTRAQESTSATTKNTSGKTYKMILAITKKMINDIGSEVAGEVPSGTVNGANVDFTIANTPITGSVKVFLNGARQKATVDYTISGTIITFAYAPVDGDSILADYRY